MTHLYYINKRFSLGMAGFFGIIAYAIYNYRKKDASTKPSVYVIQTRVAAQGFVIGILTLTAGYHMYKNILNRNEPHENALNVSEYKDKKH